MKQNDLIYYFKSNASKKRFIDFKNGIKLFKKMKSDEMTLEEAKNSQMCLNQI